MTQQLSTTLIANKNDFECIDGTAFLIRKHVRLSTLSESSTFVDSAKREHDIRTDENQKLPMYNQL